MNTTRPQALVTGGSRGIGRAICLELAAQGYDILFTFRSNHEMAKSLEDELRGKGAEAKGYAVDMADLPSLEGTLEKIFSENSRVEVLVNNAGVAIDGLA